MGANEGIRLGGFKLPFDCRAWEIDQAIKELIKEGAITEDVTKVVRKQAIDIARKERVDQRRLLKFIGPQAAKDTIAKVFRKKCEGEQE